MLTIGPVDNNQTNVSFGYKLPKRVFHDIRDIPRLKCACCGEDMLTKTEMKDFTDSFLAGSKRALENSAMERFRGTPAYEFISGLSEIAPKKTVRELISMRENKIKIGTLGPKTQIDINMIALTADGISLKAPRVMQKLEKYRSLFGEEDKVILDLMDKYALLYPKKTFAEIFNMPEVIEYHREIHSANLERDKDTRINVFKRLKELGDTLNPDDSRALKETNSNAVRVLNNIYYQPHIKRELIRDIYKNFAANATGKVPKRKIMKIIEDLPMGGMTPDRFVVEAVDKKSSDMDIVNYFAKRLQATYEHFKARSNEGEDRQKNIIVLCQKCNEERSDLPYPFFLRFHPEMVQNIQKQINKIITFIKHGKLDGYEDFPVANKAVVLEESADILRPKIGKFLKFKKERAQTQLQKAQTAFENDTNACNEAGQQLEEIDAQIKGLEAQIRKLKKSRGTLAARYKDTIASKEYSQMMLSKRENALNDIQQTIDEDLQINESLKHQKRNIKKSK